MEMTMRTDKMTMTDYEIQSTLAKLDHFLLQLDANINWHRVQKTLEPLDPSRKNVAGRDSYDPLKMFKVTLVQSWYDWADPEMEFYLRTNLLFINFCQFSITESKLDLPAALCGGKDLWLPETQLWLEPNQILRVT